MLADIDGRLEALRHKKKSDFVFKFGAQRLAEIMSTINGKLTATVTITVDKDTTEVDCSGTLSTWSFLPGSRLTAADVKALAANIKARPITVVVNGVAYTTLGPVISDQDDLPKTISAVELVRRVRHVWDRFSHSGTCFSALHQPPPTGGFFPFFLFPLRCDVSTFELSLRGWGADCWCLRWHV